jgi:predicted aminopeptidase
MLLNRGRPLDEVVEDERTDPELRKLLQRIPEIRTFGESQGLRPTPNYREYVQLEGDAVVQVVTVSEALELRPVHFRFPIVGSFTYIGWFDREDAEHFAREYRDRGLDVDIRGAPAYSTLGWFRDPLLSSMIPKSVEGRILPDAWPALVEVFLHESVHSTLYFNDQSYFNERLADFLAERLTERFFAGRPVPEVEIFRQAEGRKRNSERIRKRFADAAQELDTLYRSGLPDQEKRNRKRTVFDELKRETGVRREINNATLIQFKTYDPEDQGFSELFEAVGGGVGRFLELLSKLTAEDFAGVHQENLKPVLSKLKQGIKD